jgi:G:T/U-mismatch repair DNA glycosylase
MLPEIWAVQMNVVFVGPAVTALSEKLGFRHLELRDRFWELLALGSFTPKRLITREEAKALADGHRTGSLSDPVRLMFIEKKTSQLLKSGVGLTELNRSVVVASEKDKSAIPTEEDVRSFLEKARQLRPATLAFVTSPEVFVDALKSLHPDASETLGQQPFTIGSSNVWLLGSTTGSTRKEVVARQEDLFFELGEKALG